MWWFPPAFLVAAGLLSLAWTAFLLIEITKTVELVVDAAVSLSSRQQARNGAPALHRRPVVRNQPGSIRSLPRRTHYSVANTANLPL